MSNQNHAPPQNEDQLVELPESKERWEIAEVVDEAIAAGVESEFMRSEYYYQYKQGGRVISGLTASMYAHLALVEGISIDPEATKFTENDGWLDCHVVAYRTLPDGSKDYAEGFGSRELNQDKRERKFVRQTVWSIAARNARKQLIPFDKVVLALDNFINAEKGSIPGDPGYQQRQQPPPQQQQQSLPPAQEQPPPVEQPPTEDPVDTARKQAFATFHNHKGYLKGLGVEEDAFWGAVRERYNVASRADMTLENWKNLTASLELRHQSTSNEYATWIEALVPEEAPDPGDGVGF